MPRYVIAESALADIDEILSVIIPENENAAWDWLATLHEKFGILASSPRIGRIREDLLPSVHMFPFGSYLIFYDIAADSIQVVHVVHSARDMRRTFAPD